MFCDHGGHTRNPGHGHVLTMFTCVSLSLVSKKLFGVYADRLVDWVIKQGLQPAHPQGRSRTMMGCANAAAVPRRLTPGPAGAMGLAHAHAQPTKLHALQF